MQFFTLYLWIYIFNVHFEEPLNSLIFFCISRFYVSFSFQFSLYFAFVLLSNILVNILNSTFKTEINILCYIHRNSTFSIRFSVHDKQVHTVAERKRGFVYHTQGIRCESQGSSVCNFNNRSVFIKKNNTLHWEYIKLKCIIVSKTLITVKSY